jgi:hypothetical protein
MRVIAAWFALMLCAGFLASMSTSCAINHKSDALACSTAADCDNGRVCKDGFCIDLSAPDARSDIDGAIPNDGRFPDGNTIVDAGGIDGSTDICPQGCTSCTFGDHKTCIVDCSAPGAACGAQVTCPPTWNCDIKCNTPNSCRNGVSCAAGEDCNISCTGSASCRNLICGHGACDVACDAQNSCRGVSCGNACACDVSCDGFQSCGDTVICTSPTCTDFNGCSSFLPGCDDCAP